MTVLTTDIREANGVTVVDLNGRISLGEAAGTLRDTIRGLVAQGKNRILLNFSGVSYIDSAGLGALVESLNVVTTGGGQLKLFSLPKFINDLLRLTGLIRLFPVHEDENAAVRSFD